MRIRVRVRIRIRIGVNKKSKSKKNSRARSVIDWLMDMVARRRDGSDDGGKSKSERYRVL